MTSITDAARLAESPDWAERKQAVGLLAKVSSPKAAELLVALLDDADVGVVDAAAGALLERGAGAWRLVLKALWRNEGVGVAEAIRGAATDRIVAGDPVAPLLERLADGDPDPDVRKGAAEIQMALGFRAVEWLEEEPEEPEGRTKLDQSRRGLDPAT